MSDVWTMIVKEWKEVLRQRGSLRGGLVGLLLTLGVFAVFLPLQMGRAWVESPITLAYWAWVPFFLVNTVIADSIAGERERKTLETLLASRLPDRAILLGKVVAGISYGWGFTLVSLVVGLVTVNVAHGREGLVLYPAGTVVAIVALGLLGAALAAGAGVLVSMRAATVRQAQQTLSLATIALWMGPIFGLQLLPPDWRAGLGQWLSTAGLGRILLVAGAVLAALDVGLLAAALARFRRSRLTLT